MTDRIRVYVCTGSDCGGSKSFRESVRGALPSDVEIQRVRCQKICKGQVLGLERDGVLRWFKKMDSKTALVAFARYVEDGSINKKLERRRSKKRDGKLR